MVTWNPKNFRGGNCGHCYQKEKKKKMKRKKKEKEKFNLMYAKCGLYF